MKKREFKSIAEAFGVIPKALKSKMKKENIKVSEASRREVLNIIFLYTPDLMFSRVTGDGTVEYFDRDMPKKLSDAMAFENKREFNDEK